MKTSEVTRNVLIIDDEPDMLSGFASLLSALGYKSKGVTGGNEALMLLKEEDFDLIFCDFLMPGLNGLEFIKEAQKTAPHIPIIIFTAYGTIERAVTAMKGGAFDFLEKPVDTIKLKAVLEKGMKQRLLFKEKSSLIKQLEERYRFDNIVGKSRTMKKIFEMIENISDSEANILITGESGTGKELIARSIHVHSSRKLKPFIPVNCGAFPEHLFEAELFGYEKGAYTGALHKKIGLLEYANEGTFFLDEVCEMQSNLQVKLLRVLQDHKLRRLGGNELINVDFRVISATNRNVEQWLEQGLIRRDFYYRLNVIHIDLPPLRERKDDILLLAEHFLQKISSRYNKQVNSLTHEAKEILESYSYPGNVRELENIIERAVTLTKTSEITADELPPLLSKKNRGTDNGKMNFSELKQNAVSSVEKEYLLSLLEKNKGNVTKVSEEAHMSRRNIHRLLKLHGIDPSKWRKE